MMPGVPTLLAYKVCRIQNDGSWISAGITGKEDPIGPYVGPMGWVITYRLNETAWPAFDSKGLYIFDTLQHARSFASRYGPTVILGCKVSPDISPVSRVSMQMRAEDLRQFWLGRKNQLLAAPPGTLLAPWVHPVRVLSP